MDLDKLKQLGEQYVESARQQLRSRGEITPLIILLDSPTADDEILGIAGILVSEAGKDAVSALVRAKIAEHGYRVVIQMVDTYKLAFPPEKAPLILGLKNMGYSNLQLQAMGIGACVDTVMYLVETADGQGFEMSLPYAKVGGRVVHIGEVEMREGQTAVGRLMFFS